jgi:L-ascorbate metabolism protein UlaG (beta-lactamase superfamily)
MRNVLGDARDTAGHALGLTRDTAGHALDLARYAASRSRRDRDDADATRELTARTLELPADLEIEWLGTAGYRLSYQDHTLLIDPFVSRVPAGAVLRGRTALPDPELVRRYIRPVGTVVGVLVGHTHWDHALDTPEIARRYGCPALGSTSLARLMQLHGLGGQAVDVEHYRRYELGPFTVSFVPSAHSKLLLGLKAPFTGNISCEVLAALNPAAYRCGQTWGIHIEVAGIQLYHQGSADLVDDAVRHHDVDIFLAGIAGRSFSKDYWRRILTRLRPDVVIPMHYDDFTRPLDAPMGFTVDVKVAEVDDEIRAVSRDVQVAALPLLGSR